MNNREPVHLHPSCLHIRHKLVYCDSRHAVPGMVDDSSDTRVFFCILTQDPLGPDRRAVHPLECSAVRACYCPGVPDTQSATGSTA